MQSTEEYLDQLLASVSEEESGNDANKNSNGTKRKSIEELDESELTEEALQKQLALLLGLEVEEDEEFDSIPMENFLPVAEPEPVPIVAEPEPVPAVSNTGVLSADEIAALFATMETDNTVEKEEEISEPTEPVQKVVADPEPIAAPETVPAVSDTGVLSADEIAALFASMEAENAAENEDTVSGDMVPKQEAAVEIEPVKTEESAPAVSDSGVLSADEIAALFASMEAESDAEILETAETVQEDMTDNMPALESELAGNNGELTREELEELGLGDIADILVDSEQEILSESLFEELMTTEDTSEEITEMVEEESLSGYEEFPDFNLGEEVLLDLENIDEMLEATAKLAEEESASFDAGLQAEEDIMSMLTQFEEESVQENMAAMEESARAAEQAVAMAMEEEENVTEPVEEESGKKKRKKAKKEKVKKEKPVKEKKERKSLKDKVSAFMFEEENEDENPDDGKVPLGDGDELAYIDMPMEEEIPKKKKEKGSKKEKKAKASKKDEKIKDENAEIAEELAAEDKKKAQKKEKPKKEKKPKKVVISDIEPVEEKKSTKRGIGTKGIVATLLVCASILGLILVGTYFLPQQLSLTAARVAFYAGDYEEAAMRLEGKDLSDSDRIMYEKSSLLYGLEERYHQYEIYQMRGMDKEALNALLQGVSVCNEELILAEQLGIETEWKMCKERFLNALLQEYSLDEETVEQICALKNPYYTVAVENILAGRAYDDMSLYGGTVSATEDEDVSTEEPAGEDNTMSADGVMNPEELEDLLPEEAIIIEQLQQENNADDRTDTNDNTSGDRELFTGSVEGGEVNFVE